MTKIISVAPSMPYFDWQVSLLKYSAIKYGVNPHDIIILSPTQNTQSDSGDYKMKEDVIYIKPFWEIINYYSEDLLPINIPTSIFQILHTIEDDCVYCIVDPDMCMFKPLYQLKDFDVAHDPVYEQWHMFYNEKNSEYKQYSNNGSYSGFVPIYIKGAVLKEMVPKWIDTHLMLHKSNKHHMHQWWLGMFSYNIVINNMDLKVEEDRLCVVPGYENKISMNMSWIHYSIKNDLFNKKDFVSWDIKRVMRKKFYTTSDLPEYLLFEIMKEWSGG